MEKTLMEREVRPFNSELQKNRICGGLKSRYLLFHHSRDTVTTRYNSICQFKCLYSLATVTNNFRVKLGNRPMVSESVYVTVSELLFRNSNNRINWTIIMPVVLYGYEAWPLSLLYEMNFSVFESNILRKI